MPGYTELTLGENDDGRRVDRILRRALPEASLGAIYRAIRTGAVRINGGRTRAESRAAAGDILRLPAWIPGATTVGRPDRPTGSAAGNLDDRVLYRDGDIVVINKYAGELTHGTGSLAEAVIEYLQGSLETGLSFTPGPLHRLDRNTSGAIAFSASLNGARSFSNQLHDRRVRKTYLALVSATVFATDSIRWTSRLLRDASSRRTRSGAGGAEAVSIVRPVAGERDWTLVLVDLLTGRPHQIRAQAAEHDVPLLGDRKYGGRAWSGGGYFLHASRLQFTAQDNPVTVHAPLHHADRRRLVRFCGANTVALAESRLIEEFQ